MKSKFFSPFFSVPPVVPRWFPGGSPGGSPRETRLARVEVPRLQQRRILPGKGVEVVKAQPLGLSHKRGEIMIIIIIMVNKMLISIHVNI